MFCCTMNAAHIGQHSRNCETLRNVNCPNHRVIAHDTAGEKRWCDFCGQDAAGNQIRPGSGGWAIPSSRRL